jgi:hypothetical protein
MIGHIDRPVSATAQSSVIVLADGASVELEDRPGHGSPGRDGMTDPVIFSKRESEERKNPRSCL